MNTEDCIFCRIARGEIPATTVCEETDCLAFMDIGPVVKGHVLVIPRQHYATLTEAPPQVLADLLRLVQRIVRAQRKGLGAEGCNVIQNNGRVAGQLVPHLHFHVIPRFADDGHHWNWDAKKYADQNEMQGYADRIRQALES